MTALTYDTLKVGLGGYLSRLLVPKFPLIDPGPATDPLRQELSPDDMVFLTLGGGSGLHLEYGFDRPFITVRTLGKQHDYAGAEELALDVDDYLLSFDGSSMIGETYLLFITRTGGRPELAQHDVADRYHFACSYIADSESGL